MVWVTLGGVAVLTIAAIMVAARRKGGVSGDRDLGIVSSSWLNERRASDRESDHNR